MSHVTLRIDNPSTGELYGTVPASDETDVAAAVAAAHDTFAESRRTPAADRGCALREIASRIEADAGQLTETRSPNSSCSWLDPARRSGSCRCRRTIRRCAGRT